MPAHKHAEQMMEYAADALETETPWERWECRVNGTDQRWASFTESNPSWSTEYEYRRKPRTVTVNGIELPAPYRGDMKHGDPYYSSSNPAWGMIKWTNDGIDRTRMEYGQLHLTQEAARQWQDALKKITS